MKWHHKYKPHLGSEWYSVPLLKPSSQKQHMKNVQIITQDWRVLTVWLMMRKASEMSIKTQASWTASVIFYWIFLMILQDQWAKSLSFFNRNKNWKLKSLGLWIKGTFFLCHRYHILIWKKFYNVLMKKGDYETKCFIEGKIKWPSCKIRPC